MKLQKKDAEKSTEVLVNPSLFIVLLCDLDIRLFFELTLGLVRRVDATEEKDVCVIKLDQGHCAPLAVY